MDCACLTGHGCQIPCESRLKEKIDAKELIENEVGGLMMKTEKKILLEVGDKLEFFTREKRQKKLGE